VSGAFAHPGGLDASGGHYNHATGEYHFHQGGGGAGFSGMGFGALGAGNNPPRVRVRARTTARTKARTEANLSGRQAPLAASYSPDEQKSPVGAVDSEQRARELLRLAKLLNDQRKIPGALGYLKELATKYPDTEAAKEGATLAAKLQGALKSIGRLP